MIKKPRNIPQDSQLLEGIGASSWFHITLEKELYRIMRFSLEGVLECSFLFKPKEKGFNIKTSYRFTYLSQCKSCIIKQKNTYFHFEIAEYED